jgi:hypothetical protein
LEFQHGSKVSPFPRFLSDGLILMLTLARLVDLRSPRRWLVKTNLRDRVFRARSPSTDSIGRLNVLVLHEHLRLPIDLLGSGGRLITKAPMAMPMLTNHTPTMIDWLLQPETQTASQFSNPKAKILYSERPFLYR